MRNFILGILCLAALVMVGKEPVGAQQADVPEPAFMSFVATVPYVPVYKGRDPFKPLGTVDRTNLLSIGELEYHGVIKMGDIPLALFSWRGNRAVRYVLKSRKLYMGDDRRVDGVVGDITDNEVVLVQGDRKIVYPRSQRRP